MATQKHGKLYTKVSNSIYEIQLPVDITSADVVSALGYTPPQSDTDTHYSTHLYAGTGTAANATVASTANVYLTVTDNTTVRNKVQVAGGGAVKVTATSGADGLITISAPVVTNTDSKVTQTSTATSGNYPLLFKNTVSSANVTEGTRFGIGITANPFTNTITATSFAGTATSAVSATSATNATTVNGLTVSTAVPANAKFTDTIYSHSTYTSRATSFVKVGNDAEGHVNSTTNVTANDIITTLGTSAVSSATNAGNANTVNNLTVSTAVPANALFTDTHYSTHLYAGTGTAANATTVNGSSFLTVTDNNTVRNKVKIVGSGNVEVTTTSGTDGLITISGLTGVTSATKALYNIATSNGVVTDATATTANNIVTLLSTTAVSSSVNATNAGTATNATSFGGYTSATLSTALGALAPKASPALTGTPTAPTNTTASTSSTQIATTAFVQNAIDAKAAGHLVYKGTISANTDLPHTNHSQGWYYKVTGLTGTATIAGHTVENGDVLICNSTATTSNNAHWDAVQGNTNVETSGLLYVGNTWTAGQVVTATADGVQTTGFTISKSVPANAVFTDTKVTQTSTVNTTNSAYPLLFKNTTATATITDTARFTPNITVNPTGVITATSFAGIATSAVNADSAATATSATNADNANTVNGLTVSTAVPANAKFTDTHWSTHLYAGTGTAENATTTNGNAYIAVTDNATVRNKVKIVGSGAVAVTTTSGNDGLITISAPSVTNTDSKVTQTVTTSNVEYPILAKNTSASATITDTARFASGITINPSTNTVKADTFKVLSSISFSATGTNIPATNTDNQAKFLRGDGTWADVASAASAGSVNGFTVSKSVPANAVFTDTHNSAFNYLGTSGATANATTNTTNTTTYLTLVDGNTLRSNLQIKGAGATTVVANNGILTISSVNSTYTIPGVFTGATATTNGTSGLVLAPTSAQYTYLLQGNKTWVNPATLTVSSAASAGNATTVNGLTVSTAVPANAKFTDTVYTHSAYTSRAVAFVKVGNDALGHVNSTTAVTGADISSTLGTSAVASATNATSATNFGGYTSATLSTALGALAPKASPALTGTPTAPTPATNNSSTQIATTAFVRTVQPIGSATYVKQATYGNAVNNLNHDTFGAVFNAPTQNYRVALATWPGNNDNVLLYSVTNEDITAGSNTVNKSLTWNAATGVLTATSFAGTATDAEVVHISGAETISGQKTLKSSLVRNGTLAQNSITSGNINIIGADATANGAGIWLYGNDSTSSGRARIQVHGTSYYQLDAQINGTLSWNGTNISTTTFSGTTVALSNGTNIPAENTTNHTKYLRGDGTWADVASAASAGSVNGFTVSKSVPANAIFTDTHNSAFNYFGTSGATANATTATTNTTTYITLVDGGTLRSNLQIKGAGATTVVANNGVLTISSVNSTYTIPGVFGAATATANGTSGLVPAPTSGQQTYLLKGNKTWVNPTTLTVSSATNAGTATNATSFGGYTSATLATKFGNYLPLAGGTTTGNITVGGGAIFCTVDTTSTASGQTNRQIRMNAQTNGNMGIWDINYSKWVLRIDSLGNVTMSGHANTAGSCTGNAATATTAGNVTGTVAIANGGTGGTTRLAAFRNINSANCGTNATHFVGLKSDWSVCGYVSVADVKTVLGLGTAAYTSTGAFAAAGHTHSYLPLTGGTCTGNVAIVRSTAANTSMWIDNASNGKVGFIANTNGNHGVYDHTNGQWMVCVGADGGITRVGVSFGTGAKSGTGTAGAIHFQYV